MLIWPVRARGRALMITALILCGVLMIELSGGYVIGMRSGAHDECGAF
jgi:hypothetical protein